MSAFVCSPLAVLVAVDFFADFISLPRPARGATDLIPMLGNQRDYSPCGWQQLRRREAVGPLAITAKRPEDHEPRLGTEVNRALIADYCQVVRRRLMVEVRKSSSRFFRLDGHAN